MKWLIEETEKCRKKKNKKYFQHNHSISLFWGRAAAAIFIFALLGGGIWVINRQSGNDILPGGNRAVLTLDDGSQIVLDNAHNGTLAQQGNAEIVKLDDGKLAYDIVSNEKSQIISNKITTPRGGQYFVSLPDGTNVWLNATSSIKFPATFTGNKRNVEITGEVYFEVAFDANAPFIVKIGNAEVKVLGTHFNINAYEDENDVKVTLLEGKVMISSSLAPSVSLSPGQQASLSKTGDLEVAKIDPNDAITWKNGYFQFNQDDIQTVMRQISRWYDVEVEYESTIPKQLFAGEMQRNLTLSQVLNILEKSQVKFKIKDRKIIVMN